jgi:hypothetical protein
VGTYRFIYIFPEICKNDSIVTLPNGTQTVGPHTGATGAGSGGVYNVNPDLVRPRDQLFYGAVSNPVTFVCQEEPVPSWTESPLPNDYWTRPINNAARLWSALPGNWLDGSYRGGAWGQPMGASGGTTTRFLYGVGTETSDIPRLRRRLC